MHNRIVLKKYRFCIKIVILLFTLLNNFPSLAQSLCGGGSGNCPANPGNPPCWRLMSSWAPTGSDCNTTSISDGCINFSNGSLCSYNVRRCACLDRTSSFHVTADLFLGSNTTAGTGEGIAFILKRDAWDDGGYGQNLGYNNMTGPWLAIEFDTSPNAGEIDCQHSAVYYRTTAAGAITEAKSPVCLNGALPPSSYDARNASIPITIQYNATTTTLQVSFNGLLLYSITINLGTLFGTTCLQYGFAASTGSVAQNQRVCNAELAIGLPVSLLEFKGETVQQKGVLLNWKTASEKNNKEFIVYRSFDNIDWNVVDKVEGSGFSSSVKKYYLFDTILTNQQKIIYYKLKQVDFDGTEETFPIIAVKNDHISNVQVQIVPNPNNGQFNLFLTGINTDDTVLNKIFCLQGQELVPISITNEGNLTRINASNLKPGIYIIETITTEGHFTNRLTID